MIIMFITKGREAFIGANTTNSLNWQGVFHGEDWTAVVVLILMAFIKAEFDHSAGGFG